MAALILGLGAAEARGWAQTRTQGYVLPRVPPEKMRALLSPGPGKLPGGYRFVGAQIDKVAILARYRSAAGEPEITVMLGNPSQTRGKPLQTRKFSLLLHGLISRKAPHGRALLAALAAHVRAREGSWRWIRAELKPAEVRELHEKYRLRMTPSYSLDWLALLLPLVLLLGPLLCWWVGRRRPAPPSPQGAGPGRSPIWDRFDLYALGIVALLLASVAWPLLSFPITGDEATNLEPRFWSRWFWGHESSAHPPLFRFLIHLTARDYEPLWLIRGPVALFAGIAVWLFWRLARARTTPWLALACTAALAMSGSHWEHAFQQKSLWLWLCLLLAAHGRFERALAGERRHWAHYAAWSTLALLTHYLSVAYLAGHALHVALRHRREILSLALALAPAALSTLILSIAVVGGESDRVSGYDPAGSYLGQLLDIVVASGLVIVLLAAPAALLGPREREDSGLLPMLLVGIVVTLALAFRMALWPRYFFPVLPLGLLWVAGRLRRRTDWLHAAQLVSVGLALLFLLAGFRRSVTNTIRAARATTLHDSYHRAAPAAAARSRPAVVLVHPGWRFPMVHYQLTGRRHLRATGCPGQRSPNYHVRSGEALVAVGHNVQPARLDRLLVQVGQLDVLLYSVHDGSSSREVSRWVRTHCQPLVAHRSKGRAETGTAYRCRAGPPTGADVCKALGRYDSK